MAGALLAFLLAPAARAGFTVKISGESGFNAPPALPNLRTVNFDAVTLAAEVSASRLTTGGTAMTPRACPAWPMPERSLWW